MIKYISSLVGIILMSTSSYSQNESNIENSSVYRDVAFLSNDSLEGREMGTRGELLAANYIATRFAEIGLSCPVNEDSYLQKFSKRIYPNPHDTSNYKSVVGRNVIGVLNPGHDEYIVIGAHYDHLGWGGEGSGSLSTEHSIHNGADDNASGIAGLLDLAKRLQQKRLKHTLIFVAFTGEEKGLLGSNYFANTVLETPANVSFMINMDMIGRLNEENELAVYGVGTSPTFIKQIERANRQNFQIVMDSSGIGPSDHTSFYLKDIPVLHFFTGQHEQYHTPDDDIEYINFEGLNNISDFLYRLIVKLEKTKDLQFTKTRDPERKNERRSFNVTLGIIPDYLYEGVGLKIDGVKEGKTASLAGILKDDILVHLGDKKIDNIYDYMEVLELYHPGDRVQATIIRKDEKISLTVEFLD